MEDLFLTQDQANRLTKTVKCFLKRYSAILRERSKGKMVVEDKDGRKFCIHYLFAAGNNHIQFMEAKTKLTLVRINLNDSFHKNADGSIITGIRVNVFSESEYYEKADGTTHTRAFPLPYSNIRNSDDFIEALHDLLDYTEVRQQDKLNLTIETDLFK